MNRVTIGEIKGYLGLDGGENCAAINALLAVMLSSAEHIAEKILRAPIDENTPEIIKTAVLYTVWQLYFHRDDSEFKASALEATLAVMLSDLRRKEF